jgi:hypothetical protein
MDNDTLDLFHKANMAKQKLVFGQITLEQATTKIQPFVDYLNAVAKEKAKENGTIPIRHDINSFLKGTQI